MIPVDKRKIIGTIIGVLLFVICMLAATYAYYTWRSANTAVNLTISDVKFEFTTDSSVNATNIGPILDYTNSSYYTDANKGKYLVYTDFTADNQINKTYYMTVSLDIESISSSLQVESFKYALLKYDSANSSYDYDNPVKEGNFSNFVLGKNIIGVDIEVGTKVNARYRFVVYIDGNVYNNSSMMNSSLNSNLELVASYNKVSTASTYVSNLYNDGSSITTVNIGGSSSNPQVKLNATQGIMLDNNGEYRYYGANPNNYVRFNGELWRIISVSDVDNGTGNKQRRMKIIRNGTLGRFSFDSSDSSIKSGMGLNDWVNSDINSELNDIYYNRGIGICFNGRYNATTTCDFSNVGLGTEAKSMISEALYNLGAFYDSNNKFASDYYSAERSNIVYSCSDESCGSVRVSTWVGVVGLMYPSDYLYATDLSVCTSYASAYNDSNCMDNDWILSISDFWNWTITPRSDNSGMAFFIHYDGRVQWTNNAYNAGDINPVVYLNNDVNIVLGTGTSSDPYILSS